MEVILDIAQPEKLGIGLATGTKPSSGQHILVNPS
jgi:hypothetical protein